MNASLRFAVVLLLLGFTKGIGAEQMSPSMRRAVRMYPSVLDNSSPLGRAVNKETDWIEANDRARLNDPEGFEKLVRKHAALLGIQPVHPNPEDILAEMERLSRELPQLAIDPARDCILAAMASGDFATDKMAPQGVRNRHLGMNGQLESGVAYDGVSVGAAGAVRTLEMQRFLEMRHLVPDVLSDSNMVAVSRNRIRYLAQILRVDINAMEQRWAAQDINAELNQVRSEIDALARDQQILQQQINRLRSEQITIRR